MQMYENKKGTEEISNEHSTYYTLDKITLDGGIRQWVTGAEYPCKGYTSPEAMFACNQVKRLFILGVKTIGPWIFLIGWRKLLSSFIDISWKVMAEHILMYEYMTEVGQEIQDITYEFLIRMNISEDESRKFSKIFSHLIEYDNAYRYRVIDLFSESSVDKWRYPIKEIKRLIKICEERDDPGVADRFKKLGQLVSLMLLFPKARKVLGSILEESNFSKLQADHIDRYWMSMRSDYKYEGLSYEERKAKYSKLKMPKPCQK